MLEQPAEPLLTDDLAAARRWQAGGDRRPIADALVRPAFVVVVDELADDVVQVLLAEGEKGDGSRMP